MGYNKAKIKMFNNKNQIKESALKHHLNVVNNRVGVLVVVGGAIVLVSIDYALKITFTEAVPLNSFAVIIVLAALGWALQAFNRRQNRVLSIFLYAYLHVIAFIALAFVFPLPSPYVLFVMVLPLLIYFDLGIKASYISMTAWGVAMVARYASEGLLQTKEFGMYMIYYVISILFVDYMVNFLKIADDERKALEVVSEQSELERTRLQILVNNLNDAVIACDQNFNILLSNPRAQTMLNTEKQLTGQSLDKLLDLRGANKKPISLAGLMSKHPDKNIHVFSDNRLYYSEKEAIDIYIAVSRIQRGNEGGNGYVVLLRDITKAKSLEEERNEFISIMSHELRTPVSIVEGGISLAQAYTKNGMDDKVAEYLEKAHVQALMLAEIVNSLSTLVHSERDGSHLEMKEVDPKAVVDHLKTAYQPQVEAKGLGLVVRQGAGLPMLYSNEEYIFEVLQNLMTNAIKYTKKGTITIAVEPSGAKHVAFSVQDSGIGISKSDLEHIYDKFWRSEDFHTRESGGTGLGLYITKKLVSKLGAKMDVDSELGKGTTFTFIVPVNPTR